MGTTSTGRAGRGVMLMVAASGACVALCAGESLGQLVPPVPARTPATPEFVPPPAPPPPPAMDDRPPPAPLPSIIERDLEGKIIELENSPEETALMALDLTDEERAAVVKEIETFRGEVDRVLAKNLVAYLELERAMAALKPDSGLDALASMTAGARVFADQKLLKHLEKSGAVSQRQTVRAKRVADAYTQARREEALKAVDGQDIPAIATATFKLSMDEALFETRRAFDRLSGRMAVGFIGHLRHANPSTEQMNQMTGIVFAQQTPSVKEVRGALTTVLTPSQVEKMARNAVPELFEE